MTVFEETVFQDLEHQEHLELDPISTLRNSDQRFRVDRAEDGCKFCFERFHVSSNQLEGFWIGREVNVGEQVKEDLQTHVDLQCVEGLQVLRQHHPSYHVVQGDLY